MNRNARTAEICNAYGDVVMKHCEKHTTTCTGLNANYCKVTFHNLGDIGL